MDAQLISECPHRFSRQIIEYRWNENVRCGTQSLNGTSCQARWRINNNAIEGILYNWVVKQGAS